jgi:L-alanine-DL-glutamate epimerase-like enolase superfamily enzyme
MLDANQLWSLEQAVAAAESLERYEPRWLEEPLRADDLPGYVQLAAATPIPVAAGENLSTGFRFREFLDAGVLAVAQPNVVRVGGITPFLRIATDAAERGIPILPHLLPELSGQLAMCLPAETMVEDVEDASLAALGVLAEPAPIRLDSARAVLVDRPGLGLVLR